jgi:23S rRNA pseudoU1915 N3-methylase RlmH
MQINVSFVSESGKKQAKKGLNAYQIFFRKKMKEWGISSPKQLNEEQSKKFFAEVRDEWAKKKLANKSKGLRSHSAEASGLDLTSESANLKDSAMRIYVSFVSESGKKQAKKGLNAYQIFFRKKMKEWGISSPKQLNEEQSKKFFAEVRDEWAKKKLK